MSTESVYVGVHDVPHKKTGVPVQGSTGSTGLGSQQTPSLSRNAAGSRSGTLKRVAFKDEQTVHDDGASSIR